MFLSLLVVGFLSLLVVGFLTFWVVGFLPFWVVEFLFPHKLGFSFHLLGEVFCSQFFCNGFRIWG